MTQQSKHSLGLLAATIAFTAFTAASAFADSAGATFSDGDNFSEKTGQELYANVCQACHMDQGQGAVGAGKYPALAKNVNLEAGGYPVYVLLHGLKGMPPVGKMMSDDQVAAVVNYVRTNFGNDYKDAVTAEDVAGSR
ncbi:c-type cytochrome [Aminobacter aganoensis]|uniref:Mono/diheme cytochrome c family protein n=1 Tax=Aminobacter aganoensis TaxID=83264 RepID=A0A7X0F461_9HYPH|nr:MULTISPECIES: cytochrome c [Aminobacter]KQU76134.1 cytochrome C [Aminobacter sp. DSM 101952]MBB6352735.1 mono/diheme cytochrome c family protein [Aminobacter aganoensis]